MGRWGGGLFQGDVDLDVIDDMNALAGLDRLVSEENGAKDADDDEQCRFSICADYRDRDDIPLVREHLDSGVLKDLFAATGMSSYEFVILGACAMTLGCTISKHYKNKLNKSYKNVGLMEEGVQQMEQALKEYKNGEPYGFDSPGIIETMMMIVDKHQEGKGDKAEAGKEKEKEGSA